MRKDILLTLCACTFLFSCDSATHDGTVSVKYAINSSSGASARVRYRVTTNEQVVWTQAEGNARDGWEYEFSAQEGSHLLYISTEEVIGGVVEAKIYINNKLYRSHEHAAGYTYSTRASSGWGRNEDIKLTYTVQSQNIEDAQFKMPSGTQHVTTDDFIVDTGPILRASREFVNDAGYEASLNTIWGTIESGYDCVWIQIEYEPLEGEGYVLASKTECGAQPISLSESIVVPGY